MILDDGYPRAARAQLPPSAVREILKVTEQPEVISFAGGLPAAEAFPVEPIAAAYAAMFAREGAAALQYGTTEGHLPLRAWLAARLSAHGRPITAEELMITTGSQQGLDLVSRTLLDPGDVVVVEAPSYLAALQVFAACQARVVTVATDADGVVPEALDEVLRAHRAKLVYLVPDFQNPAGTRLSMERRPRVLEVAARHRVAILEDDPYGELSYEGPRFPPLYTLDREGVVIYLGTFSKTLAPGLRIGWVAAPRPLLRSVVVLKQASDLHTGTVAQRAVATLLERFDFEAHLGRIRALYRGRAAAMQGALERHMPAGVRWNAPQGGLFVWVALLPSTDVGAVWRDAIAAKVAFVPGDPFYATPHPPPHMRLNFSHRDEAAIAEGIARLGRVLRG